MEICLLKNKINYSIIDHVLFNKSIPSILVDTIPKDARGQNSVNLGLEIVSNTLETKVIKWWDKIENVPQVIYFNIFYPTHIFNMLAFLRKNGISLTKKDRQHIVIVGGQGVSNLRGALDNIVDYIFKGEVEGFTENIIDTNNFYRAARIESQPVINTKLN